MVINIIACVFVNLPLHNGRFNFVRNINLSNLYSCNWFNADAALANDIQPIVAGIVTGNEPPDVANAQLAVTIPFNNDGSDPCEYYDIRNEFPNIYKQLYDKLLEYNKSMVTPLFSLYPADFNGSDPSKHDGFWSPWK